MQRALERAAVGAFGWFKRTLTDERLDFAVAQLDCDADELAGASMAGEALTFGGQVDAPTRVILAVFPVRDRGEVFAHLCGLSLAAVPCTQDDRAPAPAQATQTVCARQQDPARLEGSRMRRLCCEERQYGLGRRRSLTSFKVDFFAPPHVACALT